VAPALADDLVAHRRESPHGLPTRNPRQSGHGYSPTATWRTSSPAGAERYGAVGPRSASHLSTSSFASVSMAA
jgi:hypothetical protein